MRLSRIAAARERVSTSSLARLAGATIGLTNLVGLLNYRVGLFFIERLLGLSATGVYSIAIVVAELLWFVSGSLTQAVYGRIGTPDRARAAATTIRALQLGVAALLVAAPLLWLAAWLLVPWALGPAYAASLPVLALLLPGALLFGGASALSAYFTNHAGAPQVPAQVAALSLAVNAGLALLLVPRLGMAGAALAASVAYAGSVLLLAWRFARHAGLPLAQVLRPGAQLLQVIEPTMSADLMAELSRATEVTADLHLNRDGTVGEVRLLARLPRSVQRVLLSALSQWRFAPLPEPTVHRVQLVFER